MTGSKLSSAAWFSTGVQGRHVLIGLMIFFGVMLIANGLLVYYAVGTFSGGDRPDPYRSGLNYNQTIAAAERQAALGWNVDVNYEGVGRRLVVRFADKSAEPITGLKLSARLARPAENRKDSIVTLREWREGTYIADIALDPGNWVVSVSSGAQSTGSPPYRLKRRLFVSGGS